MHGLICSGHSKVTRCLNTNVKKGDSNRAAKAVLVLSKLLKRIAALGARTHTAALPPICLNISKSYVKHF